MCQWSVAATMSSLAIVRIDSSAGLPDAVRRLRRGLRDVWDRMARCRWQWRDVRFADMAGGDHTALVLVPHQDIERREVQDVLRRRWPDVVVKSLEQEEPTVAMSPDDAAALGRRCRGVEPLRIVNHAPARSAGGHLAYHRANARDRLIVVDGAIRPVQKSPSFRAIES
jgi:hypothetical protein